MKDKDMCYEEFKVEGTLEGSDDDDEEEEVASPLPKGQNQQKTGLASIALKKVVPNTSAARFSNQGLPKTSQGKKPVKKEVDYNA